MSGENKGDPGRLSAGTVALAFLVFVGLTAVSGYVAGLIAQTPHTAFPWDVAAGVATATGTSLLAFTTALLAWSTNRDVSATWASVGLTHKEQDERYRPIVVIESVEPIGYSTVDQGRLSFGVFVSVRNVGLGPALNLVVNADYSGPIAVDRDGTVSHHPPVLAAGERAQQLPFRWETTWTVPQCSAAGDPAVPHFHVFGDFQDRTLSKPEPMVPLVRGMSQA